MDSRTQERVEEWDSRPFNGGFDGLSDLADGDFSGAVSATGTWLFMLNGRIVGVIDGDIADFETASGTRYEAPHPSLPLLCTMEERGGEPRAKYYTNETPLREVDGTLQSGSFTGYIELSENVLSGDYYAVYYGGRRMAAAYIGNAERLHTGDDAFERAADEVGIYAVTDVEIDVVDVPETADADTGSRSETDPTTDAETVDPPVDAGAADLSPAPDSASDPTTDSATDSPTPSIDPIDVSDTDPVATDDAAGSDAIEDAADDEPTLSSEIDLTGEATGITTTDESETESESATAGITDSGLSVDLDPASDPDETAADNERSPAEQDTRAETESTAYADPDTGSTGSIGSKSESESTPAESGVEGSSAEEGTAPDPTDADSTESEPSTTTETTTASTETVVEPTETVDSAEVDGADTDDPRPTSDDGSASSPDLAEVEAAAEELDQNDISWVDEDDADEDRGADEDETSAMESSDADPATAGEEASAEDGLEEQFEREEEWRETRRIPSIDPENSEAVSDSSAGGREAKLDRSSPDPSSSEQSSNPADTSTADAPSNDDRAGSKDSAAETSETSPAAASGSRTGRSQDPESARSRSEAADATDPSDERVVALTEKVETLQEHRDALVAKADELEAERDRLQSKNEDLSGTVERLQARIEELETELQRARQREVSETETGASAGTQLSAQQALSGTNLFVRYGSKSQPTLETAHSGNADRSEVASNLRLEHHTGFDSTDAAVDGTPYEEFLESTMEYRFVDWVTEMLLYEIRDTGNADGLGDLYDAIPRIDRAELGATISLADDETEDVPDQVTFDVVAYDKMGNPLVLVTLNDSREPATQELLGELEEAASAVKANYPDLAAAIAVTSSYFEPGALEVAEQATSGGFLSRGSKLSYVNLSRKNGYHLCLVESRSEGFHMNVPEL
ncbi:transcriptional regulator [Natrinema sp. H-ect4]|uniref:DUF7527 domain-containing protein n=1 Tax=Natrinema sp. H-ect4 TaxID=3242699 RepID=UPI0035A8ED02